MQTNPTKTSASVKCVRDIRDYPPDAYRLPTDGRKWKRLCEDRQKLALWLATYADGDGTGIFVGLARMEKSLGWSHGRLCQRIKDLKTLGLLITDGRISERGTAIRYLNLDVLAARVQNSDVPESTIEHARVQNRQSKSPGLTEQKSRIEQQESIPRMDTTDSLTDITTDHKQTEQLTEDVVCGLFVNKFVSYEGQIPKLTNDHRAFLTAKANEHGLDTFGRVVDLYLPKARLDRDTKWHAAELVKDFGGYIAALNYAATQTQDDAQQKAVQDHSSKVAAYRIILNSLRAEFVDTLPDDIRSLISSAKKAEYGTVVPELNEILSELSNQQNQFLKPKAYELKDILGAQ